MDKIIWLVIMIPISLLFTGIGIYAWRRKKPMWFWYGSSVKKSEISDIAGYNRVNGMEDQRDDFIVIVAGYPDLMIKE